MNATFPTGPPTRRARSRRARRSAGPALGLPAVALAAAVVLGLGAVAFLGSQFSSHPAPNFPTLAPTTPVGLEVDVNTLAEGFPEDLLPQPPRSTLTTSDVDLQDGGRTTVSLTGETSDPVSSLLSFYRTHLKSRGFTEIPGGTIEGADGSMFVRSAGAELLTLAIVKHGNSCSFSIGGTVTLQESEASRSQSPEDGTSEDGTSQNGASDSRTPDSQNAVDGTSDNTTSN